MNKKYESYCREGACPSIVVNNNRNLTPKQTLVVLNKLYYRIGAGMPLILDDCDDTGYKHTHCSWGVCTDSLEIYDKAEMHTFPMDFDKDGRESALELAEGIDCPMRKRNEYDDYSAANSGCFYQCRVFQRNIQTPTRNDALALYKTTLAKVRAMINE